MPKHTLQVTMEVDFPGLPQTTNSLHRILEQALDRRDYTVGAIIPREEPDPLWPDMVALMATHMHPNSHPGTYSEALRHMQYCSACNASDLGQHYVAILGSYYADDLAAVRDRLHAVALATLSDGEAWWGAVEGMATTWGNLVTLRRRLRQRTVQPNGHAASESVALGLARAFADVGARWHEDF